MSITRLLQQASGGSGVSGDPYFADVSLLLDGDGTNGADNNTFTDSSSNGNTVLVGGVVYQGSFSPYATSEPLDMTTDGGSVYFDGSNNINLSVSDATAFDFSTGDFTVECFFYQTAEGSSNFSIVAAAAARNVYFGLGSGFSGGLTMFSGASGTDIYSGPASMPALNQWNHLVWQRRGGRGQMYVNGTRVYDAVYSADFGTVQSGFRVGSSSYYTGSYISNGYISDFRVVKGAGVYDGATITVPTAPLSPISGTELLLKGTDAGIYDLSGTSDIVTLNGAAISTSVKKYGTGSLDLTSSKYLEASTADSFDVGGAFTVEFWVNYNSTSGNQTLIDSDPSTEFYIAYYSGRVYVANRGSNILEPLHTPVVGQWYHYAVVCDGSTYKLYVDGQLLGTSTATLQSTVIDAWAVGARANGSLSSNCYIDDLRITKGVARYTSNFTPPTEALPKF
jgi:hypothetical protein